ncbi:phosphoribosylanthranilate isomerase [Selenomonadales bacterium 4137-cl]|uniref:N-(5'-phosphoribosyl)anthranilate isomerase n=1 Tax=Anaeroselena agilis TaxID=3063788 RepID=A0ABU3P2L4_9FIRM|nr:phosphoribosylanthranilate isomerase [Selenomonadales bacterium 4137-cl]
MIIKICGITTIDAACAARDAGADLIGFVFAPSRRRVSVAAAAEIARQVAGVGRVGVFVNQPLAVVQDTARRCCLDYVQLHGGEPPAYCRAVGWPIIKAMPVGPGFDPAAAAAAYPAEYILLDSLVPGQAGGTGVAFDWRRASGFTAGLPGPFIVAGGLTPANVGEAIRILRPAGIDVSGGVETAGAKDAAKIRQFVAAARAAQEGGETCSPA